MELGHQLYCVSFNNSRRSGRSVYASTLLLDMNRSVTRYPTSDARDFVAVDQRRPHRTERRFCAAAPYRSSRGQR
jgi:hypothetical protein